MCVTCLTGITNYAHIKNAVTGQTDPYEEVHHELSGQLRPTLVGSTLVAHLVDPTTAKLDVLFILRKSKPMKIVITYIAQGDRTENLLDIFNSGSIDINSPTTYASEIEDFVEQMIQAS